MSKKEKQIKNTIEFVLGILICLCSSFFVYKEIISAQYWIVVLFFGFAFIHDSYKENESSILTLAEKYIDKKFS